MPLFVFVKAGYTLDGHVIRLCGPRRKNYVLRVSTNKVGNVLAIFIRIGYLESKRPIANLPCILHPLLRLPPVCVCSTVRISVLVGQVGEHGIQDTRVYRCSGLGIVRRLHQKWYGFYHLHVEVNWSSLLGRSIFPLWELQLEAEHICRN